MKSVVVESRLAAAPEVVWARVATMAGVNRELMPAARMTFPAKFDRLDTADVPLGEVLFRSWVLLGGVLPYDRHALRLIELDPGRGFHEESTSWAQRRWTHIRSLAPVDGGTLIRDEVLFQPRLSFLAPLLRPIIAGVFRHRHRVLRRDFGAL